MSDVLIERLETGDQGTFGRIVVGTLVLFTGELPWRENRFQRSCIPPGEYNARMVYVPKFKRHCYWLQPTAPRTSILMHAATFMGDIEKGYRTHLQGCIALGEKLGWIERQKCVLLSTPAMRRFEELMQRKPFTLEIRESYQ